LHQLRAWEKKLYREVKERERLQLRQDKTLKELRNQEYSRKINVDIQKVEPASDRARAVQRRLPGRGCELLRHLQALGHPPRALGAPALPPPELSSSPVAAELAAFVDG
jgi:hypothetical protein